MSKYPVTKSDVAVVQASLQCAACEKSLFERPWYVSMDFRNVGESVKISGDLCEECADWLVSKIRESLPDDEDE